MLYASISSEMKRSDVLRTVSNVAVVGVNVVDSYSILFKTNLEFVTLPIIRHKK